MNMYNKRFLGGCIMTEQKNKSKIHYFTRGMKFGIPIGLGYFAVSISLGIAARNAGLTSFQAALTSLLLNASAGEYAAFSLMAADAGFLEIAIMEFVANARYLLMSCALSQKLGPETKLRHKMLISFAVTDECFGVSMSQPEKVSPYLYFGMMAVAMPCWCVGTYIGVVLGNVLPVLVVNALSVSLYGMFLAIVIPEGKRNSIVLGIIFISMLLSFSLELLPFLKSVSAGTKTILLTVIISAVAAYMFPIKEEPADEL